AEYLADCVGVWHRQKFECTAKAVLMQEGKTINNIYAPIWVMAPGVGRTTKRTQFGARWRRLCWMQSTLPILRIAAGEWEFWERGCICLMERGISSEGLRRELDTHQETVSKEVAFLQRQCR